MVVGWRVEVGAADRARGVRAEPRVDARGVEGMAADGGEKPDGVGKMERLEEDGEEAEEEDE